MVLNGSIGMLSVYLPLASGMICDKKTKGNVVMMFAVIMN